MQMRQNKPFKQDTTNTSVTMREATQYHLSLNLELLKGCQFKCDGCHVDKEGSVVTDEHVTNLHKWIDSMQHDGNYLPTIVFIGPTDFMSASNTLEVLDDPRMASVIARFKRLSLQTTYLNIAGFEKIAEVLRKNYSHMELELNFVLEPLQIYNPKYIQTLKDNRDACYSMLGWEKPLVSFCIMNVYEYEGIKKRDVVEILADYRKLHDRVKQEFDTTIDFNFSLSRQKWMGSKEIEQAIRRVSDIFDHGVDHEFNQTIRFSFGKLTDSLIEKHYNWAGGKWYVSPLLYERYATFDERLRVPMKDYSVTEVEDFEDALIVDQYENSVNKVDCNTCPYLGTCVVRFIPKLMDIYGFERCIIARKALDAVNDLTSTA